MNSMVGSRDGMRKRKSLPGDFVGFLVVAAIWASFAALIIYVKDDASSQLAEMQTTLSHCESCDDI